uniref:Uncharacterized protein n=1 Tax=viral metagenome TaxID=1070528 RepID=A0A6C0AG43_9ZZZZ
MNETKTTKQKIKDTITPEEFDESNLCTPEIVPVTTDDGIKIFYVNYLYKYEYENEKGDVLPYIAHLKVQFPLLKSRKGIVTKQKVDKNKVPIFQKDGSEKVESKIGVTMNMSDEKQAACCNLPPDERNPDRKTGFYERLKLGLAKKLLEVKGSLGPEIASKKKAEDIAGCFRQFVWFKTDQITGDTIEGSHPSVYFTLKAYGKPGTEGRYETPFYSGIKDANGKFSKTSWDVLSNSTIEFEPLVSFTQLSIIGAGINFKSKTESVIFSSCEKLEDEVLQTDLLEKRFNENRSQIDSLNSKVELLSKMFKETQSLVEEKKPEERKEEPKKTSPKKVTNNYQSDDDEVEPLKPTSGKNLVLPSDDEDEDEDEDEKEKRRLKELKKNKRISKN